MTALISGLGQHIMIGSFNDGNSLARFDTPRRVEGSSRPNLAQKAREIAENHISKGTSEIVAKIITRVDTEAQIGRFKMTHTLKSNEVHLKDNIIKQLTTSGFKVTFRPPNQREPEVSLEIAW